MCVGFLYNFVSGYSIPVVVWFYLFVTSFDSNSSIMCQVDLPGVLLDVDRQTENIMHPIQSHTRLQLCAFMFAYTQSSQFDTEEPRGDHTLLLKLCCVCISIVYLHVAASFFMGVSYCSIRFDFTNCLVFSMTSFHLSMAILTLLIFLRLCMLLHGC